MIEFISSHWWIWIPIIAILMYLTRQNNKKLRARGLAPQKTQSKYSEQLSQKKTSAVRKLASKLGLSGLLNYILPRK